jgi:uncharacterized protein GlcG (DUF336 family)
VSISSEMARRVLEASKQKAHELRSQVSIAIVDAGGHLVVFERMMAPYGFATGDISIAKAHTAVMFNQSTDEVAQWGSAIPGFATSLATMTHGQFIMTAGGWPLRINGITIGGIGISGGNAPGRDDEIARAGLDALQALAPTAPPMPQAPVAPQPLPAYAQAGQPPSYSQPLYAQVASYTSEARNNGGHSTSTPPATEARTTTYHLSQDNPVSSDRPSTLQQQDADNSFRSNNPPNPPQVDHPGDQA